MSKQLDQTGLGHVLLSLRQWITGFRPAIVTDATLTGEGTAESPLSAAACRSMTKAEVNRLFEKIFGEERSMLESEVTELCDSIFQGA